jgi:REP element-mobilizing transposase RayT
MLCGEGFEHRKQWVEDRLELLADCFAVAVCGFAVMDNHLHLLVRLDPAQADRWSGQEVIRRWAKAYPPKNALRQPIEVTREWIRVQARDAKLVAKWRGRLANLGWFMKALKEPLARLANREDACKGTFWESRYKSIAILDEESLLATCAYIDLNPVAAGIATVPEQSRHTSIRQRVMHIRRKGAEKRLKEARRGAVAASKAAGNLEQDHWLCPMEDRRSSGGAREGMLEGFSLGSYLLLVDYTSRWHRTGKGRVDAAVAEIFDRLGSSSDIWNQRMQDLFSRERLLGNFFSAKRTQLQALATRMGVQRLANLNGCRAG